MSRRPHLIAAVGSLAALVLAGCGGTLHVDQFPVTPVGKEKCQAFLRDLPSHIADQPTSRVTGSTFAAAWGEEDPIVLRCGVEEPDGFDKTSECNMADGIGWFAPPAQADDQDSEVTLTTVHRSPAISITVPATLRPPVAAMVDLAGIIKLRTTATGECR